MAPGIEKKKEDQKKNTQKGVGKRNETQKKKDQKRLQDTIERIEARADGESKQRIAVIQGELDKDKDDDHDDDDDDDMESDTPSEVNSDSELGKHTGTASEHAIENDATAVANTKGVEEPKPGEITDGSVQADNNGSNQSIEEQNDENSGFKQEDKDEAPPLFVPKNKPPVQKPDGDGKRRASSEDTSNTSHQSRSSSEDTSHQSRLSSEDTTYTSHQSRSSKGIASDSEEEPILVYGAALAPDEAYETRAWITAWGQKRFFNMYGSRRSPDWQIEKWSDLQYTSPDEEEMSFAANRLGDEMVGKTYKLNSPHFAGISGVIWLRKPRCSMEDNLALLNPELRGPGHGTKKRLALTYVRVVWQINGKDVRSWETRKTVRRVDPDADLKIYHAARDQVAKYEAGKPKKSESQSRSASPLNMSSKPSSPQPTTSDDPQKEKENVEKEKVIELFCNLSNCSSFADLPATQQMKCMEVWAARRKELGFDKTRTA
jgi:hypothetical protein